MTGLKEKLTLDQNRDIEIQFREIAQALFQNYHVEKKVKINEKEENIRYDFLEIEFYYFSKDHQDFTTYPRETEAGNWFFHASGVDIAFKSEKTDCAIPKSKTRNRKMITSGSFGGILIRSLLKTMGGEKPQMIAGPYKCVDELFDTFDADDFLVQGDFGLKLKLEQEVMLMSQREFLYWFLIFILLGFIFILLTK